jgi:hypothetical protein
LQGFAELLRRLRETQGSIQLSRSEATRVCREGFTPEQG